MRNLNGLAMDPRRSVVAERNVRFPGSPPYRRKAGAGQTDETRQMRGSVRGSRGAGEVVGAQTGAGTVYTPERALDPVPLGTLRASLPVGWIHSGP